MHDILTANTNPEESQDPTLSRVHCDNVKGLELSPFPEHSSLWHCHSDHGYTFMESGQARDFVRWSHILHIWKTSFPKSASLSIYSLFFDSERLSLFHASALEVVYSKTNRLGMRVVSRTRKNSAMGDATMDGKSGVRMS